MVDLATLVVKLQAQTADFVKGMEEGKEAIKELTETVGDQVKEIVEKFLEFEAIKKAFEFVSELTEETTKLVEMANVLGLTADELTRLQFAAKLSGVDDIIAPIERMARAAGEATEGNTKLIATFQQFGISLTDIRNLSTEQLFEKLADGVSKYGDSLEKVRGVQQILGRASAEDIALLNKGAEGIKEAGQEAEQFGLGLSQEAAEGIKELNDDLDRLAGIASGVLRQAFAGTAPYLTKLIDQLVEFFKENRDVVFNTINETITAISGLGETLKPIIDLVSAAYNLLKAIADPIIHEIGPALEVNGRAILVIIEELAQGIQFLSQQSSLFKEFADEVLLALQLIGTALLTVGTTVEVVTRGIQGAFEVYDLYQQIPSKTDFLLHPIESTNKFLELQKEAQASVQKTADDINSAFDRGDVQLDKLWGNAATSVKQFGDAQLQTFNIQKQLEESLSGTLFDSAPKPAFHAFDEKAFTDFSKTIDEITKQLDKLNGQINTFGDGQLAAQVYDVNFGKVADQIEKINGLTKAQQLQFLDLARITHQITPDVFDALSTAIKNGVTVGDALKKSLIDDYVALQALRNTDAIEKLDEQILKLSGHEKDAAEAAALLANRQLQASLDQQQAVAALSGLGGTDKRAAAQDQINQLQEKANELLEQYKSAAQDANSTDEKTQSDAIAKRAVVLAQLDALLDKMRAFANASGDESLLKQTLETQQQISKAANDAAQADIDASTKRNTQLAEYNDLQKQSQVIQAQLADQIAQINDLQAHGAISELDAQDKEDEARKNAIDQLNTIHDKMGQIAKDSDNPAIRDGFTKMGTSITQLHSQLDQLGKTIRDDFVNESSSAFSDFILGTKSAGAAAKEFLQGIESDLIRLINKHLFEQIFEGTFGGAQGGGVGGSGISLGSLFGLFGAGAGAGIGASADALATSTLADYSASFSLAEIAPLALAKGGPVQANTKYLVGEEGPELFLPDDDSAPQIVGIQGPTQVYAKQSGKIVPHDKIQGMFADHDMMYQLERRASGGDVNAGQPYLVGEEGPELMIPGTSGTIVPHDAIQGKQQIVNNHFYISAPTGQVSRATQSQIAANAARAVQMANHRNN